MVAMIRPKGKARDIAYAILGVPFGDTRKKRKKKKEVENTEV